MLRHLSNRIEMILPTPPSPASLTLKNSIRTTINHTIYEIYALLYNNAWVCAICHNQPSIIKSVWWEWCFAYISRWTLVWMAGKGALRIGFKTLIPRSAHCGFGGNRKNMTRFAVFALAHTMLRFHKSIFLIHTTRTFFLLLICNLKWKTRFVCSVCFPTRLS